MDLKSHFFKFHNPPTSQMIHKFTSPLQDPLYGKVYSQLYDDNLEEGIYKKPENIIPGEQYPGNISHFIIAVTDVVDGMQVEEYYTDNTCCVTKYECNRMNIVVDIHKNTSSHKKQLIKKMFDTTWSTKKIPQNKWIEICGCITYINDKLYFRITNIDAIEHDLKQSKIFTDGTCLVKGSECCIKKIYVTHINIITSTQIAQPTLKPRPLLQRIPIPTNESIQTTPNITQNITPNITPPTTPTIITNAKIFTHTQSPLNSEYKTVSNQTTQKILQIDSIFKTDIEEHTYISPMDPIIRKI